VLSTLHTIDAAKTIDRIIGVFPKNEETSHSDPNIAVFSLHCFPAPDSSPDGKGRIAAIEILKSTMRTREYIEKGESEGKSLIDAMEQGEQDGMQTFDGVIEKMVRNGVLTQQGAMPYATNANNLQLRLGDLGEAPVSSAPAASKEENSMLDMIER
jgi:twitching motility protein PilT